MSSSTKGATDDRGNERSLAWSDLYCWLALLASVGVYARSFFYGPPEPGRTLMYSNLFHHVSSDVMYLPLLYGDLFQNGLGIGGWTLPPAPCFFPDMLIAFLYFSVLPTAAGLVATGLSLFILNVLAFIAWAQSVGGRDRHVRTATILGAALLVLCAGSGILPVAWKLLLVPTYHTGATSCILGGLAIGVRLLKPASSPKSPWRRGLWGAYAFLVVLASASDLIFALAISGYWTAFFLVNVAVRNSDNVRRTPPIMMVTLVGTGLGIMLPGMLSLHLEALPAVGRPILDGSSWADASAAAFRDDAQIGAAAMILCALLIGAWRWSWLHPADNRGVHGAALVSSALLLVPAAVLLSNGPKLVQAERYMLYSFMVTFLGSLCVSSLALPFGRAIVGAGCIGLVVLMLQRMSPNRQDTVLDLADCVDSLAAEHNLRYGVASYWNAKMLTGLSARGVHINQVDGRLGPNLHINNLLWYRNVRGGSQSPIEYSFLILEELDETYIRKRFGDPARVAVCFGKLIWLYDRRGDRDFRGLFGADFDLWRHAIGR